MLTERELQRYDRQMMIYGFGEEGQELHFHVFPRTAEITNEFLRAFPGQRDLIHGPILLDWARSRYRAAKPDIWRTVLPAVSALKEEFNRITSRWSSTR